MADRHLIMHVVVHDDGSQSTRQWTPLDPVDAELALLGLGQPTRETHLPAALTAALAPVVQGAAVVVDRGAGSPPG